MDPAQNLGKMKQIVPNICKENDSNKLDRNQNSAEREWISVRFDEFGLVIIQLVRSVDN